MSIFSRLFARGNKATGASSSGAQDASQHPPRRRNLVTPSPSDTSTPQPAQAAKQPTRSQKKSVAPVRVIEERVSVVLRRQIPIRFDEEPRSWLGGLPRMPEGIEWPRASARKPLNFVAQVDCSALPPELWGGLGPRDGWLLLFVDFEAVTNDLRRPMARVLHIPELGPEAQPPKGLYFAHRDVIDPSGLPEVPKGAVRPHFRKWPVDLVTVDADTSGLTGGSLYDAPEDDLIVSAYNSYKGDRPMTWRGACLVLADLVYRHRPEGYERDWKGNSMGLLDYPEPDVTERNAVWVARREKIAAALPNGYNCPEFSKAQTGMEEQLYEERRKGWSRRAFKVIDEEEAKSQATLADYRRQHAVALAAGNEHAAASHANRVSYYEKNLSQIREHRTYLAALFAQYPSEDAFVAEMERVGREHLEWAQHTGQRLRALLAMAAAQNLDAPIPADAWEAIATEIATMKSTYWRKTIDTRLLEKVERGVTISLDRVLPWEVLDSYASPPGTAVELDPDTVANLEPRLRNLECDKPHKLGGQIDTVYDDRLKKGHILLFQLASDAATGWICGDLGLVYVSIDVADLEAGNFDRVRAWLEA